MKNLNDNNWESADSRFAPLQKWLQEVNPRWYLKKFSKKYFSAFDEQERLLITGTFEELIAFIQGHQMGRQDNAPTKES